MINPFGCWWTYISALQSLFNQQEIQFISLSVTVSVVANHWIKTDTFFLTEKNGTVHSSSTSPFQCTGCRRIRWPIPADALKINMNSVLLSPLIHQLIKIYVTVLIVHKRNKNIQLFWPLLLNMTGRDYNTKIEPTSAMVYAERLIDHYKWRETGKRRHENKTKLAIWIQLACYHQAHLAD